MSVVGVRASALASYLSPVCVPAACATPYGALECNITSNDTDIGLFRVLTQPRAWCTAHRPGVLEADKIPTARDDRTRDWRNATEELTLTRYQGSEGLGCIEIGISPRKPDYALDTRPSRLLEAERHTGLAPHQVREYTRKSIVDVREWKRLTLRLILYKPMTTRMENEVLGDDWREQTRFHPAPSMRRSAKKVSSRREARGTSFHFRPDVRGWVGDCSQWEGALEASCLLFIFYHYTLLITYTNKATPTSQPIALRPSSTTQDYTMQDANGSFSGSSSGPFNPASYTRQFIGSPISWRAGSYGMRSLSSSWGSRIPVGSPSAELTGGRQVTLVARQGLHDLLGHFEEVHIVLDNETSKAQAGNQVTFNQHVTSYPLSSSGLSSPSDSGNNNNSASWTAAFALILRRSDDMELAELDLKRHRLRAAGLPRAHHRRPKPLHRLTPPPSSPAHRPQTPSPSSSPLTSPHPFVLILRATCTQPSSPGSRPPPLTTFHRQAPLQRRRFNSAAQSQRQDLLHHAHTSLHPHSHTQMTRSTPRQDSRGIFESPGPDTTRRRDASAPTWQSDQAIGQGRQAAGPAAACLARAEVAANNGCLSRALLLAQCEPYTRRHVWRIAGSRVSCRRVKVERPPNINHDASTSVGSLPLTYVHHAAQLSFSTHVWPFGKRQQPQNSPSPHAQHHRTLEFELVAWLGARESPAARLEPHPAQTTQVAKPCNEQANGLKGHARLLQLCAPEGLGVWKGRLERKGWSAVHRRLGGGAEGVEREAEKRLRPFACGVGDCQRRYKNMNGLRYHYQHSGEHGAVGLALLASGQHECLQNNHSGKRREHAASSSNSNTNHQQNAATSSNYTSTNTTNTTSNTSSNAGYSTTTFAMDEDREGRKRFGGSSAFSNKGAASSQSVPVSRAGSLSRTGTPAPVTVPVSANTSPKTSPRPNAMGTTPMGGSSSLSGALGGVQMGGGTSAMTTPIQVVPVRVQQVNGVGINTGLPPLPSGVAVAAAAAAASPPPPGSASSTAGSPSAGSPPAQVTQAQMQQMAAAAYQQYAQQFQRQYQAAMQMHAVQQQGQQAAAAQQQGSPSANAKGSASPQQQGQQQQYGYGQGGGQDWMSGVGMAMDMS
ncbi:hypothetical protein DFP72DRAFT_846522 [Ephemerocybe angulata]|uniref:C2H2-type domain-containing protein n=2 Tax=Ephemerocybe angulata TaxID=980116 RepID=A0A8H6M8B1_9AGAR|nr:hypothetical protein DFP72DRAFT_846522 [Tulosesus angulatus]